ncbi:hypothetical protein MNBD_GAMMA02-223 [hydrothermal vent metagenome]|uniref:DJ-1/PfpI domain-containing protein n=1 Tax=hydrothermal vent metagenome TaxID=652676 RepID=A0A3B0VUQ1_9ZZZZ
MNTTDTHHIAFLGFNQIQLLDLIGPLEAFNAVNNISGNTVYKTVIISQHESFTSDSKVRVLSDYLLSDYQRVDQIHIDTLIIAGGSGSRNPEVYQPINAWLADHFDAIERVVTVCTGAFIMGNHPYLVG